MAPARRATANVDAPVWKSYVAVRIDAVANTTAKATLALPRSRKRVKPTSVDNGALVAAGAGFHAKHQLATRASVRSYWEALSVAERLQILMVDDPDIVKQLYKLNLSLLCVGLMQRHLKAGAVRTTTATTATATPTATTTPTAPSGPISGDEASPATGSAEQLATTTTNSATESGVTSTASDSERTYDLLEAMEFMDIGTGILTVKTELVEDVDHMFTLVTAVLHGFLVSIHVLSEAQFRDLFVTESEVINTWEDYERLIAMLVEQLMLRSYVAHLERQATEQMEALLLEASLEDKPGIKSTATSSATSSQKKKKKKKKKVKSPKVAEVDEPMETNDDHDEVLLDSESEPDKEQHSDIIVEDFMCQSECSTEDADLSGPSSPVKSIGKALNRLNPNARAFEPSLLAGVPIDELRSPTSGKRKLDDFIIHIPWQDIVNDLDEKPAAVEASEDVAMAGDLGCRRPRDKHRRRDEDAELEWHLQHMYASTASIFGWDFNEQREISPMPSAPWIDDSLWRTDPRDVVRYYFPPTDHPHASVFASAAFAPPAATPSSRYYFAPPEHHAPRTPTTSSSSTPRSAAVTPSMLPPFMSPPTAPPVSFWDEATTHHAPVFPAVFEAQPYPKFRATKSPSRRGKLAQPSATAERR